MLKSFISNEFFLSDFAGSVSSLLNRSATDFYLSGSFYFKKKGFDLVNYYSDIDYAAFYNPVVERFLINNGFIKIDLSYNDGNTVSVLRKYCMVEDRFFEISLKKDLSAFLRILDSFSFDTVAMLNRISKKDRVAFWKAQYELLANFSSAPRSMFLED